MLAEISVRVRQVCDKYDLHDTTGSLLVQYGKAWRRRKSLRQFYNNRRCSPKARFYVRPPRRLAAKAAPWSVKLPS